MSVGKVYNVMRERTTWNRSEIVRLASTLRVAEDPRSMNQDHIKQQPAADAYGIGGPSEFAEDVATPNWKAEYSGEAVKRNEIGQPEFRGETFNHPEKTAAQEEDDEEEDDNDFLEKKADVCINIARRMLPKTASESMIEDQALAFMSMPDAALIDTANRLAQQQQDQGQQDQDQKKQAQQQQDQGQQDQGQKQAQQQDQGQQTQDEQKKQAQQQQDQGQQDQGQQKQADFDAFAQQACSAFQSGDMNLAQQAINQMVQRAAQQQAPAQQGQQVQAQQPMQQMSQQITQMVQQAMQQMGQQGQPQQQVSDDQMLDQMLQEQEQPVLASLDFELESSGMDIGDIKLGSEDEALRALFASHSEVQDAFASQTGMSVQASTGMSRTAATRTVGTRPTGGVSQLGGGNASSSSGNEIDKLSGLWASAPDVRNVFGS